MPAQDAPTKGLEGLAAVLKAVLEILAGGGFVF